MLDTPNRPEPTQTLQAGSLEAAQWLRGWLERNVDTSKAARLLELLAERALAAAERGVQPALVDVGTLASEYSHQVDQANEDDPGKWVRSAKMNEWWDSREAGRVAEAQRAGLSVRLRLVRRPGGGKGNQTAWGFCFEPFIRSQSPADETDQLPSGTIQYEAEPARLAWPLRWLSPPGGFAMNSLRGLRIPSHAGH